MGSRTDEGETWPYFPTAGATAMLPAEVYVCLGVVKTENVSIMPVTCDQQVTDVDIDGTEFMKKLLAALEKK